MNKALYTQETAQKTLKNLLMLAPATLFYGLALLDGFLVYNSSFAYFRPSFRNCPNFPLGYGVDGLQVPEFALPIRERRLICALSPALGRVYQGSLEDFKQHRPCQCLHI